MVQRLIKSQDLLSPKHPLNNQHPPQAISFSNFRLIANPLTVSQTLISNCLHREWRLARLVRIACLPRLGFIRRHMDNRKPFLRQVSVYSQPKQRDSAGRLWQGHPTTQVVFLVSKMLFLFELINFTN